MIFHNEDSLIATQRCGGSSATIFLLIGFSLGSRNINFYSRSMTQFAINSYVATGLSDEAVNLAQP